MALGCPPCRGRYFDNHQQQLHADSFSLSDFCSSNQFGALMRRFFIDENDNGTFVARNIDYDSLSHLTYLTPPVPLYLDHHYENSQRYCSIELTTCPSCYIKLNITSMNLTNCDNNTKCSDCDHLFIKENNFANPTIVCGSDQTSLEYQSVGRSVTITFVFSHSYDVAFFIEFASLINTRIITGNIGDTGIIQSPHFPNAYPRDYSNEVRLQVADDQTALIQLIFDDFQLTSVSLLEIYDVNRTRLRTFTSYSFRPPVIVTLGNELTMRFYANGGRAPGFKATYSFINGSAPTLEVPSIGCGGFVDDLGGVITMVNMSSPTAAKLYDCIWLIRPLMGFQQKSHLLVRLVQFSNLEPGTKMEIRQGLTSQSPLLETLTTDRQLASEYLVPADIGFYIRLRGRLSFDFKLAIAYAAFSYAECFNIRDFVCLNHRCIDTSLRCDGFDHCGDNSDEQTACAKTSVSPQDPTWWFTHTPKYYFPKSADFAEIGTTSFVLLVASLGVVLFVSSLLALLYRMSSHSQAMRERQARIDFLRTQLANSQANAPQPVENPPSYEAPPDYAEITKTPETAIKEMLEGNLRVYIPRTPTPAKVRRNDLRHVSEADRLSCVSTDVSQLSPGSSIRYSSPVRNSSRASTPARSRHATPHGGRRVRRPSHLIPIHLTDAAQSESIVPNSPPPPYDFSPDSPFCSLPSPSAADEASIEEATNTSIIITIERHRSADLQAINDCGCPGACSCTVPTSEEQDNRTVMFLSSGESEDSSDRVPSLKRCSPIKEFLGDDCALPEENPTGGLTASISNIFKSLSLSKLSNRKIKSMNRYMSVDSLAPPRKYLKKSHWNNSM